MDIQDLLKNLHLIEIRTRKKMPGGVASSYRNVFRGEGLEFSEVREYAEGDDIRLIDWNVSARHQNLFVKQLMEERELNVVVALQCTASMDFGTSGRTKFQAAAEMAALILFSAIASGDRTGLVLFGGEMPLEFIPPGKGMHHGLLHLGRLLARPLTGRVDDFSPLLSFLTHGLRKRSVVFLAGDFLYGGWSGEALEILSRRHDLIGVAVVDRLERVGPPPGMYRLHDGGRSKATTSLSRQGALRYRELVEGRLQYLENIFRQARADFLLLSPESAPEAELHRLFLQRRGVSGRPV